MSKYRNRRTYSELCGREFHSKAEAVRGEELALLEKGKQIVKLEYQPRYLLSENPRVVYVADFRYIEDGKVIVEDVKGIMTLAARTKIAWLKQLTGIEVKIV